MDPKYIEFMLSSKEAFTEFKKLMIEEYGDKYDDYELRDMGARLLAFVDLMSSPIKRETPQFLPPKEIPPPLPGSNGSSGLPK